MTEMVDPLLYFGAGSILFFFWAYGIVSFGRDVKRKGLPALKQILRNRRAEKEEVAQREEREKRERQLY